MLQQIRATRKHDDGFTLIELLIVIVILGVLAGIVVFGVAQFRKDSQDAACAADEKTVQVAADAYDANTGSYPDSMDDLTGAPPNQYLKEAPKGTYTFNRAAKTVKQTGCNLNP